MIQRIVKLAAGTIVAGALVACGPKAIEDKTTYTGNEGASLEATGEGIVPEMPVSDADAPPAVDFDDPNARPVDADGKSATDLDLLNLALEAARQKASAPGSMKGRTMEEQMASTAPVASAPINSVEDLVKAGVIKAVPPAPDGKKYVIKKGVVVLE